MGNLTFVEQHIVDCIRAALVEARGERQRAARLRAQSKLRLVCMSDNELWELAGRTCSPPDRSVEEAYHDIRQTVDDYIRTSKEWVQQACGETSTGSSV